MPHITVHLSVAGKPAEISRTFKSSDLGTDLIKSAQEAGIGVSGSVSKWGLMLLPAAAADDAEQGVAHELVATRTLEVLGVRSGAHVQLVHKAGQHDDGHEHHNASGTGSHAVHSNNGR